MIISTTPTPTTTTTTTTTTYDVRRSTYDVRRATYHVYHVPRTTCHVLRTTMIILMAHSTGSYSLPNVAFCNIFCVLSFDTIILISVHYYYLLLLLVLHSCGSTTCILQTIHIAMTIRIAIRITRIRILLASTYGPFILGGSIASSF